MKINLKKKKKEGDVVKEERRGGDECDGREQRDGVREEGGCRKTEWTEEAGMEI